MGDYADAAIECFGPRLRDRLVPLLSPFRYELIEEPDHVIATIENLIYGGEDRLCQQLRELRIPHEFLHAGDHETEPLLRLYDPQIPETSGDAAARGEWRGSASANGEPLVRSSVLGHLLVAMPPDVDDIWLREQLEIVSALRWRRRFAAQRALAAGQPEASPEESATEDTTDDGAEG